MRTFHIFDVIDSVAILSKDDTYQLFHSFLKIKNLGENDLSLGINLYEQIASPIDRKKYTNKIYNHFKDSIFYTKFQNKHTYINKYKDEKSYLDVNSTCIKLSTNKEYPEFFKYLKKNHRFFVCDFDNKDYFWLDSI